MAKALYIVGLICFWGSFFGSTTPQKMTSSSGEEVEVWTQPSHTHFVLAAEPVLRLFDYSTMRRDPEANGDGFEVAQSEAISRAIYSIPGSVGWIVIAISVLFVPSAWLESSPSKILTRGSRIAGILLLLAAPLVAHDFYRSSPTYEAYFHVASGAYLIVAGYLLVGAGLLGQSLPKRGRTPRSSGLFRAAHRGFHGSP